MNNQIQDLQRFATTELHMTEAQLKPLVLVPGNGVQTRDTATEIYMLAGAQKGLFFSSGVVMKLHYADDDALPSLEPLSPGAAITEFEKYARFGKKGAKEGAETVLSESTAKAILLFEGAKNLLPNVKGLLNCPLPVLQNGRIVILKPGYNPGTKLIVARGTIVEPEKVEESVEIIEQILMDFTFQTDSDISRAIACLLTPALKIGGFIRDHTPIQIIEANESQTGKGFFLKLRDRLYGEKAVVISRPQGGVGSMDETFSSALLSGRPFIQFDNIRGPMKSELLEAFLTNPGSLLVRVPFAGSKTVDGSMRFLSITSNDMVTTEDLANRASFVRLEKEESKEFTRTEGKLMDEMIQFAQPRFMGAITKVIRHYHEEGMQRTGEDRHSFREWAQKLDWIVQNIFHLSPLLDGHKEAQSRVQNPALAFVRAVAIQVERVGHLDIEYKAQELANICESGGIEIPGLNKKNGEDYTDKQGAQRVGQLFGQAFADETNELLVEPYRIIRSSRLSNHIVGSSFPAKHYKFLRISEEITLETAGDEETDEAT